jgi:heptosyltransferase-2
VVRVQKRKIARFLLVRTKWNLYRFFGGSPGVAERYLEAVRLLHVKDDGKGLDVFFPSSARTEAQKVLTKEGMGEGDVFIGIAPSARHFNKIWPRERFAETAATIAREQKATVLVFGFGKVESILCQEVKLMVEQRSPGTQAVNLAGRLSLPETAAMMDFCSIVVTNDSGLMHLAAARKRKVVAVFGATVRELGFFPYGTDSSVVEDKTVSCRPCTHVGLSRCPKGHFHCMKNIVPAQVIEATRELLKKGPAP